MTTNNNYPIVHRLSRTINRTALSAAFSRAGKRKWAPAAPLSLNPVSSTFHRNSDNHLDNGRDNLSIHPTVVHPSMRRFQRNALIKPRMPVNIGAFNVRTLKQPGQQAALALTMDSLNMDICCISESRIQDPSTIIELTAPNLNSKYRLYTSGDAQSAVSGYAGVGIAVSSKAALSLMDWIPVSSRLCAIRLESSAKVSSRRMAKRSLFIISAYAPTDSSSNGPKDSFYSELQSLFLQVRSSDIVLLMGDFNAQLGRLNSSELFLGGQFSLGSTRTDNGDRLLQFCAEHQLYLSSTSFRRSNQRRATWRPPSSSQTWTQIDHIAISYRWRGCIQDCRSIWNTYVDSDHALLFCRFCIRFAGNRKKPISRIAFEKLRESNTSEQYRSQLSTRLPAAENENLENQWKIISSSLLIASKTVCGNSVSVRSSHWISPECVQLLHSRRSVPSGHEHNSTRRQLRRQISQKIRNDRETWWSQKADEMEAAGSAGDFRRLFRLIRNTGTKKVGVSETICEADGSLVCNRNRRLDRWAEHFSTQFNWPGASSSLPDPIPEAQSWDVTLEPPTVSEIHCVVNKLNRNRAAGPDDLVPALFKEGGESLINAIHKLFEAVWTNEDVPKNWTESIIVPIFKKGSRNACGNHRGISLTPVITRILASIIIRRLTGVRETQVREEQAGFRPGRGCIDQIFTLRQLLEERHAYRRPTITVFLDFKGAFDSVDRRVLLNCLKRKGMPRKYVNILQALYSNTSGQVRVYGDLSNPFQMTSGVRQGCPISPFLFNFIIDEIMETALRDFPNFGIDLLPGTKLVDLDYADDIVLLFENVAEAQRVLDKLSNTITAYGMQFAPGKCKYMMQDVSDTVVSITIGNQQLEAVDQFIYLGSCISNNGYGKCEIDNRIAKARAAFANLHHLWRQRRISIGLKGRVYNATVRRVLLYGSETWPLRVEDFKRLETFDHQCLRRIARIGWSRRLSNVNVRKLIYGSGKEADSLSQMIKLTQLRWLGHVLRMPRQRLPSRSLFSDVDASWSRRRGGQLMTWKKEMKSLTKPLAHFGSIRLPGWNHKDGPNSWMHTLKEMSGNRAQWRACCHHLVGLHAVPR